MSSTSPSPSVIPEGLSEEGQRAAEGIVQFLFERGAAHDLEDCLYSPQQWAERGERFGGNSLLIVTHEGGAHAGAFDTEQDPGELLHPAMTKRLRSLGLMSELCDSWYSAVYPHHGV